MQRTGPSPIILYRFERQDYFVEISNPALLRCGTREGRRVALVPVALVTEFLNGDRRSALALEEMLPNFRGTRPGAWDAVTSRRGRLLYPSKARFLGGQRQRRRFSHLLREQELRFRLAMRDSLIQAVTKREATLAEYLAAFTEYVFFDEFSLWVFNPGTEVFTHVASSKPPRVTHVPREAGCSLNDTLSDGFDWEERRPGVDPRSTQSADGMESLSRFVIPLGRNGFKGIVSLYSRYPRFRIQPETRQNMHSTLALKYVDTALRLHEGIFDVNDFFARRPTPDRQSAFLTELVDVLRSSFSFEQCSAYERRGNETLHKVAVSTDGPAAAAPADTATELTLTERLVESDRRIEVVYDCREAGSESAAISNWVGLELSSDGEPFAAIALINRYDAAPGLPRRRVPPTPGDYAQLSLIQGMASTHLATIRQFRDVQAERDRITDFVKVFRHEIRAPVSSLAMLPTEIEDVLKRAAGLSDSARRKVRHLVRDILSVVYRLRFLTLVHRTEELTSRPNLQRVALLQDVVFPLLNLTKSYYRQHDRMYIRAEHDSLSGVFVHADPGMLTTALNALLDNAAKYVREGGERVIRLYRRRQGERPGTVVLAIENDGLEILPDEIDTIFQNWARGSEARKAHLDGTGVGLWLAREYMRASGGDLRLRSRYAPVAFDLIMRAWSEEDEIPDTGR